MPRLDEFEEGLEELFEDLGEPITLQGRQQQTVMVFVDLNQQTAGGAEGEPVSLTGRIRFPADQRSKLRLNDEPVTLLTYQKQDWHIVHVGDENGGLIPIQIRIHDKHLTHSNTFDLSDEQARWS